MGRLLGAMLIPAIGFSPAQFSERDGWQLLAMAATFSILGHLRNGWLSAVTFAGYWAIILSVLACVAAVYLIVTPTQWRL
jgi:hypothetical protein